MSAEPGVKTIAAAPNVDPSKPLSSEPSDGLSSAKPSGDLPRKPSGDLPRPPPDSEQPRPSSARKSVELSSPSSAEPSVKPSKPSSPEPCDKLSRTKPSADEGGTKCARTGAVADKGGSKCAAEVCSSDGQIIRDWAGKCKTCETMTKGKSVMMMKARGDSDGQCEPLSELVAISPHNSGATLKPVEQREPVDWFPEGKPYRGLASGTRRGGFSTRENERVTRRERRRRWEDPMMKRRLSSRFLLFQICLLV